MPDTAASIPFFHPERYRRTSDARLRATSRKKPNTLVAMRDATTPFTRAEEEGGAGCAWLALDRIGKHSPIKGNTRGGGVVTML